MSETSKGYEPFGSAFYEAGREMDALVAEKVMGIDLDGSHPELPIRGIGGPKPYSTDIASAWEVVEKVSWLWQMHRTSMPLGYLFIAMLPGDGIDVEEHADTAPLAICRAALSAKRRAQ